MRILFIVEHFPCLSETFVLNQVTTLLDLGHDVWIFPLGRPSGSVVHPDVARYNLLARTIPNVPVPASKLRRTLQILSWVPFLTRKTGLKWLRGLNPFQYGWPAAKLVLLYPACALLKANHRFDHIQCHFGDKGICAVALRAMGALSGAVSVVFHAHELCRLSDHGGTRKFRVLFRERVLLLPISHYWRERLLRWGASPDHIAVHRMGVDLARFDYRPKPIDPSGPVRVLGVGRLVGQKGFEYAIQAVASLIRDSGWDLRLDIVGSGPLESRLRQQIADLGVERHVSLLGAKTQADVQRMMRECHVFLLPSVTDENGFQEGIPVALMEAMACGVPVVSSRHTGIPELVEHGVSGYLAGERDVAEIANCLKEVIGNAARTREIVANARGRIGREYDIQLLMRQWLQLVGDRPAQAAFRS
jgi:colanic acid/amylovoran biosynthesis glycosyltransferase